MPSKKVFCAPENKTCFRTSSVFVTCVSNSIASLLCDQQGSFVGQLIENCSGERDRSNSQTGGLTPRVMMIALAGMVGVIAVTEQGLQCNIDRRILSDSASSSNPKPAKPNSIRFPY